MSLSRTDLLRRALQGRRGPHPRVTARFDGPRATLDCNGQDPRPVRSAGKRCIPERCETGIAQKAAIAGDASLKRERAGSGADVTPVFANAINGLDPTAAIVLTLAAPAEAVDSRGAGTPAADETVAWVQPTGRTTFAVDCTHPTNCSRAPACCIASRSGLIQLTDFRLCCRIAGPGGSRLTSGDAAEASGGNLREERSGRSIGGPTRWPAIRAIPVAMPPAGLVDLEDRLCHGG
jgi:hypothetical protein